MIKKQEKKFRKKFNKKENMSTEIFIKNLQKKLKESISPNRYRHSINVRDTAVSLAKKYKVDETAVIIASLYHDIAKELSDKELLNYYEKNIVNSKSRKENNNNHSGKKEKFERVNLCLMHGSIAAQIAEEEIPKYLKHREEIINAIKYHTTSRKGMSDIEKVVYIADLIEPLRKYENIENIRDAAQVSLDEGMREALIEIVRYLNKDKKQIDKNAFYALTDYFLKNNFSDKFFINDYSLEELKVFVQFMFNEKPFRAVQIYESIYKGVDTFSNIKGISKELIAALEKNSYLYSLEVVNKQVSKIDGTVKYLFRTVDGELIESSLMKYKFGNAVCVSTQVGCNIGCKFCYSGKDGLKRNLSAAEIIDQFLILRKDFGIDKTRHIVFMGIGEPLNNFKNLMTVLKNLTDSRGLALGRKFITVSTSGIIDGLEKIVEKKLPINVAISLHHYDDEIRTKIMPITKKYGVKELMKFAREWNKKLNRRITFEYALIKDFNDSEDDAKKLSKLVRDINCHINLIRLNDSEKFKGSSEETANNFKRILEENKVIVTLRRKLGSDIDAACGMLRINNQ